MKTTSTLGTGSLFVYQTNPVKVLTQPEWELLVKIKHEADIEEGDSYRLEGRSEVNTALQLNAKGLIEIDVPKVAKEGDPVSASLTSEGKSVAERIW